MQKRITLLCGLPGSGKSYYASEICPPKSRQCYIVDCDHLWKYKSEKRNLADVVADDAVGRLHYFSHIIIDGLITTNEVANNIFTAIVTHPGCDKKYDIMFEIVWWTPDIKACMHNDRGRRELGSRITIENIVFEEPSPQLIKEWNMKNRFTRKEVVMKPAWQVWAQENGVGKDMHMKSASWCLGGVSGNCWNDYKTPINAESPPISFAEFDSLLERICPQISFLQYKKLYNETVTTETYSESAYYGGHCEYGFYVCDLPKLYSMLVDMGVITEGA